MQGVIHHRRPESTEHPLQGQSAAQAAWMLD